jgi:hypothetical protein
VITSHTSEDAMGNAFSYYSASRVTPDNMTLVGYGGTEKEATDNLDKSIKSYEEFQKAPLMEKLKSFVSGELLDTDQRSAIRIIYQILDNLEKRLK